MIAANFMEQPFYVGLRITMKDDTQLVVYISKNPTRTQTDQHIKSFQETEKIKHLIDRIINKYQLESGPVTVNKKENTFTIHSGDCGVYPLNELVKCSVVFEKARDAKHNKPFTRQMLISPMTQGFAGIYSLHIGLQITSKMETKNMRMYRKMLYSPIQMNIEKFTYRHNKCVKELSN